MNSQIHVLKIGGQECDDPGFIERLGQALSHMEGRYVIVHGGGKSISKLQAALGIETRFVNGQRYTDDRTLDVAEMVLCGTSNKLLVRRLNEVGTRAVGISGMDAKLMICELDQDLGWVGIPCTIDPTIVLHLLEGQFVPVIAPFGLDKSGHRVNVNADKFAGALARSLNATALKFITNVAGVILNDQVTEHMIPETAEEAIRSGQIHSGMIPKIRSALEVAQYGTAVKICNLDTLKEGGTYIEPGITHNRETDEHRIEYCFTNLQTTAH